MPFLIWLDDKKQTPLHIAVNDYKGDDKIIKLLINNGASLNMVDADENTALDIAITKYVKKPKSDMIKLLLKNACDINIK